MLPATCTSVVKRRCPSGVRILLSGGYGDYFGLVIQIIYMLPLTIVGCVFAVIGMLGSQSVTPNSAPTIGLGFLWLIPVLFIGGVVLGTLAMIAQTRYAISNDFGAAMKFGSVAAELREQIGAWLGVVAMFVLVLLLAIFLGTVTCGLGFLLFFGVLLAQSHWMAQAHRQAHGIDRAMLQLE